MYDYVVPHLTLTNTALYLFHNIISAVKHASLVCILLTNESQITLKVCTGSFTILSNYVAKTNQLSSENVIAIIIIAQPSKLLKAMGNLFLNEELLCQ